MSESMIASVKAQLESQENERILAHEILNAQRTRVMSLGVSDVHINKAACLLVDLSKVYVCVS